MGGRKEGSNHQNPHVWINSTPGPAEFFRVVNYTVAQHLADVPVALPDLTEVLAEVARTHVDSD